MSEMATAFAGSVAAIPADSQRFTCMVGPVRGIRPGSGGSSIRRHSGQCSWTSVARAAVCLLRAILTMT